MHRDPAGSKLKCNRSNFLEFSLWRQGMGTRYSHLSYQERFVIMDGRRDELGMRSIARRLGRDPSTVSRELRRGLAEEVGHYDASRSFFGTLARRKSRRPERRMLRPGTALFAAVAGHLREGWSPLQIARRLRRMEPDDRGRVSLYTLLRGKLRRSLLGFLRQGRQAWRPRSRGTDRRGFVPDGLRIAARPEDIAERLIAGHWEGDFLKGAGNRAAVGTLVERTSRLVMIAPMAGLDAEATRKAFESPFDQVPEGLRKTLTCDRGTEMARHAGLTRATGVKVYFAPCSPWQRGSNENMNGLIREYLPKGTKLGGFTQDDLGDIAYRLNSRPRKVLDFRTPHEVYNDLLRDALAAEAGAASP
jgi:transposase, IS30 family